MPLLAPSAQFLGAATLGAAATDIGPIVFGPGWGVIIIEAYIAGYSASQIAVVRLGVGTTVDTAANYSCFTNSFTATATAGTSRVSQTGVQVSNVAQTTARRCVITVLNSAARAKVVQIDTVDYSAATPTVASAMANGARSQGAWFNNAQAQCVSLNSGGAGTLTLASAISVYGIPGTG